MCCVVCVVVCVCCWFVSVWCARLCVRARAVACGRVIPCAVVCVLVTVPVSACPMYVHACLIVCVCASANVYVCMWVSVVATEHSALKTPPTNNINIYHQFQEMKKSK